MRRRLALGAKMTYYVYLLRCEGGELYTGIAADVERRFAEHVSGGLKAAKYTRTHRPVRMEATWAMPDRASASALEYRLKRLAHAQKEEFVSDPMCARRLVVESLRSAKVPRVLMLGNSLTTSQGLPDMLADTLGGDVAVHARGGARLSEHLNPQTRLGGMTQAALGSGGFTHVVLQERSDGPVRYRAAYLRAVSGLCAKIREAGAIPVVYATWAYAPGCVKLDGLGLDHKGMSGALQEAFAEAASVTEATMANVGAAFFEHVNPDSLYASDGVHPSADGAALAAGIIAEAIRS